MGLSPRLFHSQQGLRLHLRLWSKDLTQRAARHSLAPHAALGAAVSGFARCTLPQHPFCTNQTSASGGSCVSARSSCSTAESMSDSSEASLPSFLAGQGRGFDQGCLFVPGSGKARAVVGLPGGSEASIHVLFWLLQAIVPKLLNFPVVGELSTCQGTREMKRTGG